MAIDFKLRLCQLKSGGERLCGLGGMGQKPCDCLTYVRLGLHLANSLEIVSYWKFIFCSVLKEGEGKTALKQGCGSGNWMRKRQIFVEAESGSGERVSLPLPLWPFTLNVKNLNVVQFFCKIFDKN